MTEEFEPFILGIFCNWCSYAGADAAGTSRMQRPANLRIIRVMCSGRVDSTFVLQALAKGADGVLICGCHPGDCHYVEGNLKTERKIPIVKKLISQFGINPKRVRLEWISASEAIELTELVKEYVEEIRELGPSPLKNSKETPIKKD
ncbi:MAG: hydrogenase iron-sulfur subunit [Candidatus Lokiarchaeota archaeon]|nr:hydrogenase iron-sulfur subunit [Candidatus Lokiarchaeota archaeon]